MSKFESVLLSFRTALSKKGKAITTRAILFVWHIVNKKLSMKRVNQEETMRPRSKRFSLVLGTVFLIGVVCACLFYWRQRAEKQALTLHWRSIPVDWSEIAPVLGFSVQGIRVGEEVYSLIDCTVASFYPYSGDSIGGDFHYLRFSYRGVLSSSLDEVGENVAFVAYARPKVIRQEPMTIGFTSVEVETFTLQSLKKNEAVDLIEVLKSIVKDTIDQLTFQTRSLPIVPNEQLAPAELELPRPTVGTLDVPVLR